MHNFLALFMFLLFVTSWKEFVISCMIDSAQILDTSLIERAVRRDCGLYFEGSTKINLIALTFLLFCASFNEI